MDDPDILRLLHADAHAVLAGTGRVVLDEWQRFPALWDVVRRAVDDGAPPGRFLLTGSAAPITAPTHTGAGRIVRARMRPMSLVERQLSTPTVGVRALFAGSAEVGGECTVDLPNYVEEILRSGFPGIRTLAAAGRAAQLDGYLDYAVTHDLTYQGTTVRRPDALRRWLAAYAAATATTASYNSILDAATAGEANKPARSTVEGYREALTHLWLLDPVPGWIPGDNRLERLTASPKHHLADPALVARLLGLDASALIGHRLSEPIAVARRSGSALVGPLFESLVTQSVQVYAQAAQARVFHLRTREGRHEIDLVLERPDGAVVAIEIKLAATASDSDVTHLLWLRERLGDRLAAMVVLTTGRHAYRRPDGVAVVPAALLGP